LRLIRNTGASVEVGGLDAFLVESCPHAGEEGRERAEHQRPVPLGDQLEQVVDEHVDLGRPDPVVLRVDQRRIETELTQLGQRPEDRDPVLVEVLDEAQHGLPLPLQVGLVDAPVSWRQRHLEDLLLLRWQVRGHDLLGPPQQERPDPFAEPFEGGRVAESLDRVRDQLGETLGVRVQAGGDDREQGPQLHQPVLHRRPGQREPERYVEAPHALVRLAVVVLHGLGLVEHQPAPGLRDVVVGLEPEQGVRRHDHVGLRGHRRDRRTPPGM
jgi:hypothetical protein